MSKLRTIIRGWKPKSKPLKWLRHWLRVGSGPIPTKKMCEQAHNGPAERASIEIIFRTGEDCE